MDHLLHFNNKIIQSSMEIILYTGLGLFAFSSAIFYFISDKDFKAPFFVSFVTMISYAVMLEGSFVTQNSLGEDLYWTRWLGYALSCSILMYSISKKLKFSIPKMMSQIYLTVIVMATGAMASYMEDMSMLLFFVISSIAYGFLIYPIISAKQENKTINAFIYLGWSMFPVIFILSPEGYSLISTEVAFLFYLLLDLMTKIVFYAVVDGQIKTK